MMSLYSFNHTHVSVLAFREKYKEVLVGCEPRKGLIGFAWLGGVVSRKTNNELAMRGSRHFI